jgi:hypothetical protein
MLSTSEYLQFVYTEGLENIVEALSSGKINKADGASSKHESYAWLHAVGQENLSRHLWSDSVGI